MKCIRKDKAVIRVTNEIAAKMVGDGWQYTNKATWKAAGRPR